MAGGWATAGLLGAALVTSRLTTVHARANATGALDVFWIADCATCVADKNSIFCSNAADRADYIIDYQNSSSPVSIADKVCSQVSKLGMWFRRLERGPMNINLPHATIPSGCCAGSCDRRVVLLGG